MTAILGPIHVRHPVLGVVLGRIVLVAQHVAVGVGTEIKGWDDLRKCHGGNGLPENVRKSAFIRIFVLTNRLYDV